MIEYLRVSERSFCRENGLSHGYLDKVKQIGTDKMETILKNNPWVSPEWLLMGTGSMVRPDLDKNDKPIATSSAPAITNQQGVPYYDVDFIGGFDLVFEDQDMNPSFFIDFPPFNDADCWVNVSGKSMSPFISHGDLVALKKMDSWKDFLLFGEIYAVVTEEYRTIKIVAAGRDEDHYTLVPYSKSDEFSRQPIPKELIKHIFQVKGSIKKFF